MSSSDDIVAKAIAEARKKAEALANEPGKGGGAEGKADGEGAQAEGEPPAPTRAFTFHSNSHHASRAHRVKQWSLAGRWALAPATPRIGRVVVWSSYTCTIKCTIP